jgi:hypothetical protein
MQPRALVQSACVALVVPVVALIFLVAEGCGPSYQAVHEGDARFEHCYAIDEGAAVSMDDKAKCWREYRESYAFGQARDRLIYAARREHLLARSQQLPTDEAMMEAAPGQVAVVPNAPAPTNAMLPPPQMLTPPSVSSSASITSQGSLVASRGGDAGASLQVSAPVSLAAIEAPGAPCANRCAESWRACEKGCGSSAGASANASTNASAKANCERCAKTHKTCMAACFR